MDNRDNGLVMGMFAKINLGPVDLLNDIENYLGRRECKKLDE